MTDPFIQYLPPVAVNYCRQLWQQYAFTFRVVKPRRTRLGDFRVMPQGQTQITVNANLNPYAFLITYVHEVAHAAVHQYYRSQWRIGRKRVEAPHGKRWKTTFQQLMQPLLSETVFPVEILQPLTHYIANPAATTYAHPALVVALRQADVAVAAPISVRRIMLKDLPEGKDFQFAKKTFRRGTLRRTRVVCKEMSSGKSYTILAHALVEVDYDE
ncbi:sprT domain-containing protein [Spirosoma sp. BT702]|uniref:SprT domain-containing protein n=1 Tax=Spirosoma profusum TaxID=2771354 RepID=A0A926Y2R8_9BACT|nr:SprT-like domain-containing protein [Spirosoma profusum]MBD2701076.1 sprT domain-containing protein [Spirosoma profusum]